MTELIVGFAVFVIVLKVVIVVSPRFRRWVYSKKDVDL